MSVLVPVVEGHSEVESVRLLVLRYLARKNPPITLTVEHPIRVGRNKIVKANELERAARLAAYTAADDGAILILLDADDDCPQELAPALLDRARSVKQNVSVVIAKSELETWFLASAISLRGCRGLRDDLTPPDDPESIRDAKGWLTGNMANPRDSYSETLDQPALVSVFDFDTATSSRSFRKLLKELDRIFESFAAKP
jgi:hypothetical protein